MLGVILTLCLQKILLKPSNDAIVASADSKLSLSVVVTVTTWGLSETAVVGGAILCSLTPSPSIGRNLPRMNIIIIL